MAQKVVVENQEWEKEENLYRYCNELEKGNILYFNEIPFNFPQEEIDFLLQQKQKGSKGRKNIAYKPLLDKITNCEAQDPEVISKMHETMRNYSKRVADFLSLLLKPYSSHWQIDYASFRPFQEKGRGLRIRARNDLIHVDSFPTRPMHGARILRFFTNINPVEERRWITSESFETLAKKYAGTHGVSFPKGMDYSLKGRLERKMKEIICKTGLKIRLRSPYDHFMLNMHNFLKENSEFQANCPKDQWSFPPRSCWIVFTDMVSHAALSGQYALEQTFLVPLNALLYPEASPLRILERLSGRNMIDLVYAEEMFSRRGGCNL